MTDRDRRLSQVLADVRLALSDGRHADVEAMLAAHPDLMPELRAAVDQIDTPRRPRASATRRDAAAETVARPDRGGPPAGQLGVGGGTGFTATGTGSPAAGGTGHTATGTGPGPRPTGDTVTGAAPPSGPYRTSVQTPGYSITGELSRGGQGVVFLGTQQSTGRQVAIKVMRDGPLADERAMARFQREVEVLAALNHPNIVGIIDAGRLADGSQFIVMNYISGLGLDDYMKRRHQKDSGDPGKLLRMFHRICQAVNEAHARGIVHRDLKPSNIRVDERGEPHVLDFGLARTALGGLGGGGGVGGLQVSVTGEFLGSLPWSSPEQAEGEPDKIDVRTDVYSLGVILYQMLTGGRFPYVVVGTIRDVLNNILTAVPKPPSEVVMDLPAHPGVTTTGGVNESIERVVLKALAKRREDRYPTAGDLGRDIANYLLGRPIKPGPAPAPAVTAPPLAPAVTWRPSRLRAVAVAATVAVGAIAILAAVGLRRHHPPGDPAGPRSGGAITQPSVAMAAATTAPQALTPVAAAIDLVPTPATEPAAPVVALPTPAAPATAPTVARTATLTRGGTWRLAGEQLIQIDPTPPLATCIFGDPAWRDFDLTVDARRMAGAKNFTVLFRTAGDRQSYHYAVSWGGIRCNVGMTNGNPVHLFGIHPFVLRTGQWYTVHVAARGGRFTCTTADADGHEVDRLGFHDPTFAAGQIGLLTCESQYQFRNLRVTAPDGHALWAGFPDVPAATPAEAAALDEVPKPAAEPTAPVASIPPPATTAPAGPVAPAPAVARTAALTRGGTWLTAGGQLLQVDPTPPLATCIFGDPAWRDYDLTFEARRMAGSDHFTVLFRTVGDMKTYHYAVSNFGGKQSVVGRDDGHSYPAFKSHRFHLETGQWYAVHVTARGDRFACALADAKGTELERLSFTDGNQPNGRVGLLTCKSQYQFRNLRVTGPDGTTLWEGFPNVPAATPEQAALADLQPGAGGGAALPAAVVSPAAAPPAVDGLGPRAAWATSDSRRQLTIISREGDRFTATYRKPDEFECRVTGTIAGGTIVWLAKDAVVLSGTYTGDNAGTLHANRIDVHWSLADGTGGDFTLAPVTAK